MSGKLAFRLWGRAARYRWKLNRPEIKAMLSILPRGGIAIDCGGHKGAYSFWMARRVGIAGRVITVEPQQAMVSLMEASFAQARLDIKVIHAAASDASGQATLKVRPTSTHGATLGDFDMPTDFITTPVRAITIDEIADTESLARLDFIKIDVEGHELAVLRGGLATIDRFKPALLIESEARRHGGTDEHIRALTDMLIPRGYAGRFHDGRRWRDLSEMDVSRHQDYGHGRFCNNLLFVPAGRS